MSKNISSSRGQPRNGKPKKGARSTAKSAAPARKSDKPSVRIVKKTINSGPKAPQVSLNLAHLPVGSTKVGSVYSVPCRFRVIDRSPTARAVRVMLAGYGCAPVPSGARPTAVLGPHFAQDRTSVMDVSKGPGGPKGTGLSDCAALYAKASAAPFSSFTGLPCVPDSPPTPTQRFKTTNRGTFTTGTAAGAGFGYIMVAPYIAANNTNKFFATGSSFAGVGPATAGTGITGLPDASLPYTAAMMGGGIQARVVAAGLRVRNITQALNVGGLVGVQQVEDQQNASNFTFAQLNAMPDTALVAQALSAQGEWTQLSWRPNTMSSMDWAPDEGFTANANPTMIVYASGTPAAATFEWEYVSFWEFQGQIVGQNIPYTVLSDADQVGLDRVLDAQQRIPTSPVSSEWEKQMAYGIVEAVAHSDTVARTIEDLMGGRGGGNGVLSNIGGILKSLLGFFAI